MAAQNQKGFQDPLSAVLNQSERSLELPLEKPSAPEAPVHADSPTPSLNQPNGNQGSEVGEPDRNDATDSSSAWSPEVLQPEIEGQSRAANHLMLLLRLRISKYDTPVGGRVESIKTGG